MFQTLTSQHSPEWANAVFANQGSEIRILIVADGKIDFFEDDRGFSLSHLGDVLRGMQMPGETFTITTAHRSPQISTEADLPDFKFDKKDAITGELLFSRKHYDELWLFGSERQGSSDTLRDPELEEIIRFMEEGGGVFATGDHEDLGFALCGRIPRVRHMRRWEFNQPKRGPAPSQFGVTRIDTLREGLEPGFQAPDEEDRFPQDIRPRFFVNEASTIAEPHPLLALNQFAISVLPDHMHEGECISPKEIAAAISNGKANVAKDFPTISTGEPLLPTVVAIATTSGGTFEEGMVEPVEPRSYIAISAYDGHLVEGRKLGRVVVDASFHHFLNLNITKLMKTGGANFDAISKYYRNIVMWLRPADQELDYYIYLLLTLRFSAPLLEEIRNDSERTLINILHAGRMTNAAIERNLSSAEARSCALALASSLKSETGELIRKLVNPWQPRPVASEELVFLSSDKVVFLVLGSAILEMASKLPESQHTAAATIAELSQPQNWSSFLNGLSNAVSQGAALFQNALSRLSSPNSPTNDS